MTKLKKKSGVRGREDYFLRFLAASLIFMFLVNLMMLFDVRREAALVVNEEVVNLVFAQPVLNGDKLEVDMLAQSPAGKIAALDLYFGFNPRDWAFLSAEAGSLLAEGHFLRQETDQQAGLVRLAAFTTRPAEEAGSLLKMSFLRLNPAAETFNLDLREGLGGGNKVTVFGKQGNVLQGSEDLEYRLNGGE